MKSSSASTGSEPSFSIAPASTAIPGGKAWNHANVSQSRFWRSAGSGRNIQSSDDAYLSPNA